MFKSILQKIDVYDTFLLLEKNNSQSINNYSQADVRLKALRVILEKRFSTIEWLSNKNGVWSNYKKMTEVLVEFQGL
jgi:hypothetical protein